jgi:hypothetical protein
VTYNQVVKEIQDRLSSHPMVKEVLFQSPAAWLNSTNVPSFPSASFVINSGSLNIGREQIYNIEIWLLDKSGVDGEFEQDVTSDMHGVAYDVIQNMRQSNLFGVSNQIRWDAISEKFEDYLSGVKFSFDLSVTRKYGDCDSMINA